jgi:peptide chain release factor 2
MDQQLIQKVRTLQEEVSALIQSLKMGEREQRMRELEDRMQQQDFWQDQKSAQKVAQSYTEAKNFVEFWQRFPHQLQELLDLIAQNTDESEETVQYLEGQVQALQEQFANMKVRALLSGRYDDHSALVAVHAGAGGTDAQDWAAMLLRMYLRYAEHKGFRTEIIEQSSGSEAGIKSVLFAVNGPFAFGFFKSEAGVHRLVRLSPFNPAHTRETSFALVEVLPALEENESPVLDPKDLKIEANTSSGHGGQSVNTTYSAIRITHIPTGIRVSIQNERSQHQNKELALKILGARLQAIREQELQAEKKALRGEFKSAEWGNQIRSYVLHPYKLVKDHRTGFESSSPDTVLEGELDECIGAYLQSIV